GATRQRLGYEAEVDSPVRWVAEARRDSCRRVPQIRAGNATCCRRSAADDPHISPKQCFRVRQSSCYLRMNWPVPGRLESTAGDNVHREHLSAHWNTSVTLLRSPVHRQKQNRDCW